MICRWTANHTCIAHFALILSVMPLCAGQCLSIENLQELIKFAYDERIVLMADEVYQENIYQVCSTFRTVKRLNLS